MDMNYRPLGRSGLMVSAVGIGTNAFSRRVDQDGVNEILDAAQDVGVTLLDTADIYGDQPGASEEMLGHALQGRRDEFVVATKFGMDMRGANGEDHGVRGSRRYVRRAVEASLRRLQTDHIDLYQLHAPDPVTPIAETLGGADRAGPRGQGPLRRVLQLRGWQVADAAWICRVQGPRGVRLGAEPLLAARPHRRGRGRPRRRAVRPRGAAVLPAGVRPAHRQVQRGQAAPSGSRADLDPTRAGWLEEADWDRIEALSTYAEKRDLSLLDVAIAGLAAQPAVSSVISGVSRGEQVRTNAAALRWEPTDEDLDELDAL